MDGPNLRFSLLGPLAADVDGQQVALGGVRVRSLLAVLLLNANELVSADRLIEELWDGKPPPSAPHALQVYVSELRRALGPARDAIETRPPGYSLRVRFGELDLHLFEEDAAEAREALAANDVARAAVLFEQALAHWRGGPLADFPYAPFAQIAIRRLEELRLVAEEDRIAAELQLGRHREVLPRLQELLSGQPLRERLHEQRILALYRSGRQAEALQAFQEARSALIDELGIEPSKPLQEMERRVLNQDPLLDRVEEAVGAPAGPPPPRSILVVGVANINGQVVELAERLAGAPTPHALVAAVLVTSSRTDDPGALQEASRSVEAWRRDANGRGLAVRATAFTSADAIDDMLRLAAQQDVDLVLIESGLCIDDDGRVVAPSIFEDCAADVAVVWSRPVRTSGSVLMPFAGAGHDWAALELAAWLATALDVPLRLLGAEAAGGGRDASRLLSSAALAVQRLSQLETELELVPRGTDRILEAAQEGAALILSLPDDWRQNGIGHSRVELAKHAQPPVVLVRRGLRPGGLAPSAELTRFTWSLSQPT